MHLYGLTGGIGMGKTTCAALFAEFGLPVVDTDRLSHALTEPGMPALAEIASEFGSAVLLESGCLDRRKLARIVFCDQAARLRLEAILHPRIHELWTLEVNKWKAARVVAGVVVIPLLFETRVEAHFDTIICAACSGKTQADRLKLRGWLPEEIAQRLAAQMPVEQKMDRADYVIWSEGKFEVLAEQVCRIFPVRG